MKTETHGKNNVDCFLFSSFMAITVGILTWLGTFAIMFDPKGSYSGGWSDGYVVGAKNALQFMAFCPGNTKKLGTEIINISGVQGPTPDYWACLPDGWHQVKQP